MSTDQAVEATTDVLEEYVRRLVDQAPPLTPARRDRVRQLLRARPDTAGLRGLTTDCPNPEGAPGS